MKNKINAYVNTFLQKHKFKIYLLLSFILALGTIQVGNAIYSCYVATYNFISNPVPVYASTQVTVGKTKEPSMREWVKQEIEKAGLNWEEANAIIECESNWNVNAHQVNWDSKKGVDRGLWQISSLYHKEVTNQCAYDFRCSTKEAIRINKEWGGWGAWYCSRIVL